MNGDTQQRLLERFARHREAGTTDFAPASIRVPASHYVDASQAALEVQRLFRSGPQLVALTPDLAAPGDYLAHDVAGTALLLVRDDDGRTRAFLNACRHRGARIAEGRGRARHFSCPFHAWTYDRSGRVRARPNSCDGFADAGSAFDQLQECSCLELAGMIFVQLDGDAPLAPAVRDRLGDALGELHDYRIADTIFFGERSTTRDCNYKFIVDGFAEAYHIAALHRKTIQPYYYTHPSLTDPMGPTVRMIGVRSSVDREFDRPARERRLLPHATTQYLIPPNVVLTHQVDHLQLWRVYPVNGRSDRCEIHFSLYWPAPLDDEARRKSQFNVDVIWQVTTEEDMPQSLAMHRNLASGALPELLFGRNEPALIHYHQQIRAACGQPPLPSMQGEGEPC